MHSILSSDVIPQVITFIDGTISLKIPATFVKGRVRDNQGLVKSVERVRKSFTCSPTKSVWKTSRELTIPVTTVWKVLQKHLQLRPYYFQLL